MAPSSLVEPVCLSYKIGCRYEVLLLLLLRTASDRLAELAASLAAAWLLGLLLFAELEPNPKPSRCKPSSCETGG